MLGSALLDTSQSSATVKSDGAPYLVKIKLNPSLSALALVVHVVVLLLAHAVTSDACDASPQCSLDSIADALPKVAQLALGLLTLTLEVLLATLLLEVLVAEEVADGLFGAACSLVPLTLSAIAVVFCNCTGRADREWAGFGTGVGQVRLGGGLASGLICFGLFMSDLCCGWAGQGHT